MTIAIRSRSYAPLEGKEPAPGLGPSVGSGLQGESDRAGASLNSSTICREGTGGRRGTEHVQFAARADSNSTTPVRFELSLTSLLRNVAVFAVVCRVAYLIFTASTRVKRFPLRRSSRYRLA